MKSIKIILTIYIVITNVNYIIAQGIEINSGATISITGTATIEISNGNFVNNGTYTKGTENLIFSGTTNGNISGSSNNDFYNLTVNNTNGVTHTSVGYVAINNSLIFTAGLFNTGANTLIINDNATYSGASTTKYINGNCKKVGNDAFIFPVGNNGKYAPIGITAPTNIADHFTASYYKQNPNSLYNVTALGPGLYNVSNLEYWTLDRTNGTSNVNVSLYWDTTSGVNNLTDIRVARWDGTKWLDQGNTGTSGDTTLGNVTSDLVSSFSPFTFGSTTKDNPLPVDLLNFKAECYNGITLLNWSTASETNCDYYIVEKMNIENDFVKIASISGNGNTNQSSNYQIKDLNSNSKNYYRLTQIDYNGQENVFNNNITVSNCNDNNNEIKLFENISEIYVFVNSEIEELSTINIFDLSGKQIAKSSKLLTNGQNIISATDYNLASGMYLVNIQTNNFNKSIKLCVR